MCFVLITVPRVSRSCEHVPNGFDLHLLHFLPSTNGCPPIPISNLVLFYPNSFLSFGGLGEIPRFLSQSGQSAEQIFWRERYFLSKRLRFALSTLVSCVLVFAPILSSSPSPSLFYTHILPLSLAAASRVPPAHAFCLDHYPRPLAIVTPGLHAGQLRFRLLSRSRFRGAF